MMRSLGIGMKPGFITRSLSGPSELGSFHHIVKLCFVFRRCRMQPLSSRWETQLPWTSQRSAVFFVLFPPFFLGGGWGDDGCQAGWWFYSRQITARNLRSQPQSHGVSTKFQGVANDGHLQIWSTWILKGCWRMTWISASAVWSHTVSVKYSLADLPKSELPKGIPSKMN